MRKATPYSFSRIVNYITDPQNKEDRVKLINITNCLSYDLEGSKAEIIATQKSNTRSQSNKVYHFMISFRQEDKALTNTLCKEIENYVCSQLGYAEHQRVSAVHGDTKNLHIHVVVNKIHPVKLTSREPYYPYYTFSKCCQHLEEKYNLAIDNHSFKKSLSENRIDNLEHQTGCETLATWIKDNCASLINECKSWEEVHSVIAKVNLKLIPKGNGLVFLCQKTASETKASLVSREFSKNKLEMRFGKFTVAIKNNVSDEKSENCYTREPLNKSLAAKELYEEYRKLCSEQYSQRKKYLLLAKNRQQKKIASCKSSYKTRISFIRLSGSKGSSKKFFMKDAYYDMNKKIKKINLHYKEECQKISGAYKNIGWLAWLEREAANGRAMAEKVLKKRQNKIRQGL